MCHYRKGISEMGTANDFEVSCGGLIDILSQHVPGETEKYHGKLSHDCRCLGTVNSEVYIKGFTV